MAGGAPWWQGPLPAEARLWPELQWLQAQPWVGWQGGRACGSALRRLAVTCPWQEGLGPPGVEQWPRAQLGAVGGRQAAGAGPPSWVYGGAGMRLAPAGTRTRAGAQAVLPRALRTAQEHPSPAGGHLALRPCPGQQACAPGSPWPKGGHPPGAAHLPTTQATAGGDGSSGRLLPGHGGRVLVLRPRRLRRAPLEPPPRVPRDTALAEARAVGEGRLLACPPAAQTHPGRGRESSLRAWPTGPCLEPALHLPWPRAPRGLGPTGPRTHRPRSAVPACQAGAGPGGGLASPLLPAPGTTRQPLAHGPSLSGQGSCGGAAPGDAG